MRRIFMILFSLWSFSVVAQETLPEASDSLPQNASQAEPTPRHEFSNPFDTNAPPHVPEEGRDFMWEFMNMLVTLGIVIIALFLLMWFLRKMLNTRLQQMNTSSHVKILETRALSSKTVIYLLEIQGTGIAVAESNNGITRLSQFDLEGLSRSQQLEPQQHVNNT